jgi:archaellum component FlaF (FlaF/FlaG flagellin family)
MRKKIRPAGRPVLLDLSRSLVIIIQNTLLFKDFTKYAKLNNPEIVQDTDQNLEEMETEQKQPDTSITNKTVKVLSTTAEVKAYKLDPNTRSFSGATGEKLSQWIFFY